MKSKCIKLSLMDIVQEISLLGFDMNMNDFGFLAQKCNSGRTMKQIVNDFKLRKMRG